METFKPVKTCKPDVIEMEGRRDLLKAEFDMLDQQIENVRMSIMTLDKQLCEAREKELQL